MKLLEDGSMLDGFRVLSCLHSGGMAHITAWSMPTARPTRAFRWP